MVSPSVIARATASKSLLGPLDVGRLVHQGAGRIPDPIEFVMSDRYLGKASLYPRQGTMIKVLNLREDMFTDYDYEVVGEWEETFRRTGNEGISPGILDRMRINREAGRRWFREALAAIGRRGGKGHVGGLQGAYVTWHYMNVPGGPHHYYGIDPDKRLAAIVFAGKKEQAVAYQWRDLVNAITSSTCFQPFISKNQGERLTLYTPTDLLRLQQQQFEGIRVDKDQASIEIVPSGNTAMAGRGPAAFMEFFDEMAHIVKVGAGSDAKGIYDCLHPDTRVLTASMEWKRIEDLVVGEELVAVDEHRSGKTGVPRKIRRATVEAKWDTHQTAYRVEFDDGTSVVCSGHHRWLTTSPAGRDWRWASVVKDRRIGSAGNATPLRVGDRIKAFTDPWEQEATYGAGYLAGMLDGEGSVFKHPDGGLTVTFTQKPGAVLDEVARLLAERGFDVKNYGVTANGCINLRLRRVEDVMRLFGTLEMHRLGIDGLWEGMSLRNGRSKTITAITEVQQQRLVDMQTSTGTFIAEGLVSHNSATPALDQFGTDGFIFAGSSPWQMMGQFYDLAQLAIEMEDGQPVYPERLLIQLPSWGPYEDWKIAHTIGLAPSKKTYIDVKDSRGRIKVVEQEVVGRTYPVVRFPIQTYDEDMRKLERANPDTFAVERRSHWAASLNAYLNMTKVQAAFKPFRGEPLRMADGGPLSIYYAAHGDPAKVNDNFGFAIAHTVPPTGDEDPQFPHVVVDVVKSWRSEDFDLDEDGVRKIDYTIVQADIERMIEKFKIDHLTFDQFNCLPGDTLVSTARGLIPIGELAGDLDVGATVALDEMVAVMGGLSPTGAVHRKGPARILRLRTRHGQVLECTPEHRVYVRPAKEQPWHPTPEWVWTTADQVRPGDHVRLALGHGGGWDDLDLREHVAYPTRRNQGTPPSQMTPALASVMGALVAEGSGDGTYFRLSNSDLMFTETFCDRVYEAFGRWPSMLDAGAPTDRWAQRYQVNVPRFAARFMHAIGLSADLSQGKVVPWSILRSGQRDRAAFLAALFEGDGGVTDAKSKGEWVHLTTTSERLARQVSLMLHEMGILTTVWEGDYRYQGQARRQWRVKVFGQDLIAFRRQVGFLTERKNAALDAICAKVIDRGERVGLRDRNARFKDHYIDRVVAVEDGGVQDCYDISVPGEENFVASGVVVHNSVQIIGNLNAFVRQRGFPKRIQVYERTATKGSNWREAEVFKAALNMNLIHIPALDPDGNPSRDAELAELEMTFLEEKNGKVDHPSSGPVQTKDIADALMAVTYHLIGEQMGAFLNQALDEASRTMGASGQAGSFGAARPPEPVSQEDPIKRLAEITAASAPRGMDSGAARSRGMRRR